MSNPSFNLPPAFAELGIEPDVLRALAEIDFKEPSEIQREMIPHVLAKRDVLGQAKTGTGKTAAFGLPLIQMIDPAARMQAMVLTPTRELAAQIVGEFRRFSKYREDVHCVPVYGGTRMKEQLHQLGRKPHIVVGTPGRMMDVIARRALDLSELRIAVLDEVDRMLDIGFRDDIRKILGALTHPHQTVFVSATIDDEIKRLAMKYMHEPVEVNVSRDTLTVDDVSQFYCTAGPWDKPRLLRMVLQSEQPKLAIVFTNTKHGARKVAMRLHADGIDCKEIHGDLVQQKREKIMERFKKHKIPVLVATDLASRGIDVHMVTHIINYDLPQDAHAYVHRIGRTARMGQAGKAISFVKPDEGEQLSTIESLINKQLDKLEIAGYTPRSDPEQQRAAAAASSAPAAAQPGSAPESGVAVQQPPAAAAKLGALGGRYAVPRRFRRR